MKFIHMIVQVRSQVNIIFVYLFQQARLQNLMAKSNFVNLKRLTYNFILLLYLDE